MSYRSDLLVLVRQPVEATLNQIAEAAARHVGSPNNLALAPCVLLAHQVGGALRMVQLPGAARFASEIETALKAALRAIPADTRETGMVERAVHALRDFVNDVAGGGPYVPLRLFPVYRDLAQIGGNAAPSEKDLFFPLTQDAAPEHATPRPITPAVLPALVKDLRSRFQRGLLAWLKESAKPDGPAQMRTVLDQLHQIAAQLPEPRGLWWAATLLMDSVIELMPDPQAADWITRVKPVCSRIDFLLRDLAANAKVDAAPAQRDVYYAIASCRVATPRLRDAQRLLQLEDLVPEVHPVTGEFQIHKPVLEEARTRLENIKEVWTEYSAGEPNRLARFRELLVPLTQKARELGNLPLLHLLLAIGNSTIRLHDPYPLDGQVMSLEMAAALLMAESIVANYDGLPADLEQQVEYMKGWLADAVAGKVGTSSPPGLRAAIVQKANDEKLRIATAREILKNLQQVERTIEAYASDPFKRDTLPALVPVLRQVHGVFEVSNQKRAARLARACERLVERCAQANAGEAARDIEWLAEGLGCLGFYLDPCLHGKEPAERAINLFFTRHENAQGLQALLGVSQQMAAPRIDEAVTAPPSTAAGQPDVDREMLDVFLEEANEVLTAMETSIAQARKGEADQDALINVRRGFHTLKGSSRMVGLAAYGECAWEMEQVMNHWLAQARGSTTQLLDLAADARDLLAEWAYALRGETTPDIDASGIVARGRALRKAAPPAAGAAPHAAPVQATAVETPAPAGADADPRAITTRILSRTGITQGTPKAPPAAPEISGEPCTQPVSPNLLDTMPMPRAPRAATPAYAQTLADLGDRLSWIDGLVAEIQQHTQGAANPRLTDIAGALAESMGEARDLHRQLRELLEDYKP